MTAEKYFSILKTDPKFIDLTQDELREVLSYCEVQTFKKGDDIIKEGQHGDKLHIIVEGEVGISKIISNQVVFFITTLKVGEIFGEMAIISDYPRSANAFAKTDTVILSLSKEIFKKIKSENPLLFGKLSFVLSKVLAERLFKIEDRIKSILKATLNHEVI
ncbi:cyclic nucleotide-binding domain-containing protein [Deferribacterales bacterium Es71-Z0220]|jgi:CRP-like cAMP-binding protein|uniref:cyclic nucleotide-binding domain-containing protein n=1 Tax=Deferrivibrio essentukiensis TaxID=2880922 RepID=UPI001F6026FB|nr:cyclic nucleotide-binding domain-containing protein [Deferrivibrio essentukiensis]MBZ4671845.1 putative transcriptional regulator, Crp/Fnr family [Deferribacteraceae bacterium]MCB4204744.1 cyclic nucleotide-binding domain-containing protein [Deferrivibrio essentukiensis]